jgi:hypothetical protein
MRGDLELTLLIDNLTRLDRPEDLVESSRVMVTEHAWAAEALEEEAESLELNFASDREYDEDEAMYIMAYAQSYKDVRRELTDSRNARGLDKGRGRGGRVGKAEGKGGP